MKIASLFTAVIASLTVYCCFIAPVLLLACPLEPPAHQPKIVSRFTPKAPVSGRSIWYPNAKVGTIPVLVVAVDFPDLAATRTPAQLEDTFFGSSAYSLKNVYLRESREQLTFTGAVVGMVDGTPSTTASERTAVRAPQPISYYAGTKSGLSNEFPHNGAGLFRDVIEILNTAGFNFADFKDGAGNLADVVLVPAGNTNSKDESNQIWPHSHELRYFTDYVPYMTHDDVALSGYMFCPEFRYGTEDINTCVHEHGHALGLNDYYDYNGLTGGVGFFDIMDSAGDVVPLDERTSFETPGGHFGPFSVESLGWRELAFRTLGSWNFSSGSKEFLLRAAEEQGESIVPQYLVLLGKYSRPDHEDERFYLEYRDFSDAEGTAAKARGLCPGLFIWRYNSRESSQNSVNLGVSNTSPLSFDVVDTLRPHRIKAWYPSLSLVERPNLYPMYGARGEYGYGACASSWTSGTWNDTSTPSSRYFDGTPSGISVKILGKEEGKLRLRINIGSVSNRKKKSLKVGFSTPRFSRGKATFKATFSSRDFPFLIRRIKISQIGGGSISPVYTTLNGIVTMRLPAFKNYELSAPGFAPMKIRVGSKISVL